MSSVINSGSNSVEYWEDVGDDRGTQGGLFEIGNSVVTQNIRINWADQEQAVIDILGDANVIDGALVRTVPLQHGIYNSYYATKVVLLGGLRADGKYISFTGIGNDLALYQYAILQISYTPLPYPVTADPAALVETEYNRYCVTLAQPGIEIVKTAKRNIYAFHSSIATAIDGSKIDGSQINFPLPQILPMGDIQITWYQVPENWIFSTPGFAPNITNAVGKVNDATFPVVGGWPPGTLLMLPPKFEPVQSPKASLNQGGPNRLYNVHLFFKYFNPPTNPEDTTVVNGGHNYAPAQDGFYYLACNAYYALFGIFTQTLYQETDFLQIFEGVS